MWALTDDDGAGLARKPRISGIADPDIRDAGIPPPSG